MNKSAAACRLQIRSLCERDGVKSYLWTFTMPCVLDVSEGCRRWAAFARLWSGRMGVAGVRVFELHPRGHGLHIHVIVTSRYPVGLVRKLAQSCGLGRIHVTRVHDPMYVAKYLSKARRAAGLKGRRLWQSVGVDACSKVRVRDIVVSSSWCDCMRAACRLIPSASWGKRKAFANHLDWFRIVYGLDVVDVAGIGAALYDLPGGRALVGVMMGPAAVADALAYARARRSAA